MGLGYNDKSFKVADNLKYKTSFLLFSTLVRLYACLHHLRGLIPPELPSPQERPAPPFEVEGHCSAISLFKSAGSTATAAAERKQLSVWGSGAQQNSRRGQQPLGA